MTNMTVKTPWHLWVVGLLGLLWNGFGAYDYIMSHGAGADDYMSGMGMTEAQLAYMEAMPAWTSAPWALGVWGALLGTVLLLLRLKWAFHAFVASLIGLLISLVYSFGMSDGLAVMGTMGMVMNGIVLAGCLFFVWYSRMMMKKGVLR